MEASWPRIESEAQTQEPPFVGDLYRGWEQKFKAGGWCMGTGGWVLRSAEATPQGGARGSRVISLCENKGRQVWVWDDQLEEGEEPRLVDGQRHSGDLLLRRQMEREKGRPRGITRRGGNRVEATAAEDTAQTKRRGPLKKMSLRRRKKATPAAAAEMEEASSPARVSEDVCSPEDVALSDINDALRGGLSYIEFLQQADGHLPGDYGGPLFLMPGLVIALYTANALEEVLSREHRAAMVKYLGTHQRDDGGYGLHIEGKRSTMFGTVLNYVAMRLLGVAADDPVATKARKWIRREGGATLIPSWGKFWLCVLGVYEWEGINPMPPEMWLLPYDYFPLHPGRFWCHCRMVYLPMSYVYGIRGTAKPSALRDELRLELFEDYGVIDWDATRNMCHASDLYYPHPYIQDLLWYALHRVEPLLLQNGSLHWLRKKACAEVMKHVHYEDENTRYVDIGPVNKVINMLCCYLEDPTSDAFRKHLPRIFDYLWVAEDGMKMQGYNGSQLWDTAFAAQALESSGLVSEFKPLATKIHGYIDAAQVRDDAPEMKKFYRHISKGAWPFSTRDHGWPISDCSSEGLKAALFLNEQNFISNPIHEERLFDCVNVILSYQNGCGGWATYENTRSYPVAELLNPAETFGDIIIDYSYVECSSACITALNTFRKKYPNHRASEIAAALNRGKSFILEIQRDDGSWYGSWGVCFTYGIWFGCEALCALGETHETCPALRKAAEFLIAHQRSDGGWGESYLSCQDKVYSQLSTAEDSHVVNTAWAILGLIAAGRGKIDREPLRRAAKFLLLMQQDDGDWPQQHISGVFNRNCMITYTNYRNIFPTWALGEYRKLLGSE